MGYRPRILSIVPVTVAVTVLAMASATRIAVAVVDSTALPFSSHIQQVSQPG